MSDKHNDWLNARMMRDVDHAMWARARGVQDHIIDPGLGFVMYPTAPQYMQMFPGVLPSLAAVRAREYAVRAKSISGNYGRSKM
jgi:hypothetical protein